MDRPYRPQSRKPTGKGRAFLARVDGALSMLAGAAIVEAIAVSSFGFLPGTATVVPAAVVMGSAYLALRR